MLRFRLAARPTETGSMLIWISIKRNVTLSGCRTKSIVCEECGQAYTYELQRTTVGSDDSLISWNEASAFRKAEVNARKKLDDLLESECDPVECPQCGWVQSDMVEAVRRRSYLGLKGFVDLGWLIGLGGLLLAVVLPLLVHFAAPPDKPRAWDGSLVIVIVGLVIMQIGLMPACFFWALRKFLCWRYDPNRDYFNSSR